MRRGARLRPLVVLVVIALTALALIAVAIGSRRPSLEPFGVARNGIWLASFDGDVYSVDPDSGERVKVVGGPGYDFSPVFTRDGARVIFLRSEGPLTEPAILTLMAARPDGTEVRAISAPMERLDWFDPNPDGTQVAFMSSGRLFVAATDGSGTDRLVTGGPVHFPTWLPPHGEEIVFRREDVKPSIMAIRPDGTGLRTVSTTRANNAFDYQSISASPDGRLIGFTRWAATGASRVYVLDVATGRERALPTLGDSPQRGPVAFSPDGSLVAYGGLLRAGSWQLVVAPTDGRDAGRALGPEFATAPFDGEVAGSWAFTPDGTGVVVRYGNDSSSAYHLLGLGDGSDVRLEGGDFGFIDIQRLAP